MKWTLEKIQEEALKYSTRGEFYKLNSKAYDAAFRSKVLDLVCSHMNILRKKWSDQDIIAEALKYNTRSEFKKNNISAYQIAINRKLKAAFNHMPEKAILLGSKNPMFGISLVPVNKKWDKDSILSESIKYTTRLDFQNNSKGAYKAANRLKILDEVCQHMKFYGSESLLEQNLFDKIKFIYPKTAKLRDRKIKIEGKSHIKGFDIDIYIPELRKGIEFDGSYWYSVAGLKAGRPNWPKEDLENYHQIKDEYFKSKNIQILHIQEKEWLQDKQECIKKCMEFLE